MQPLKIGTRESELAVWQAKNVQKLLKQNSVESELVFISSEGDVDLTTPLYEMGVQGIFTKTLDSALLNKRIDIAVHSMKDVPTQLPQGIQQAAVLKRGSYKDLLVYKDASFAEKVIDNNSAETSYIIATSSIRRKAQWHYRYPHHHIENLRGNVNTRLKKLSQSNWDGAIFAAAGLERIGLRPQNSMELDWMLPAPAQGAIMVVCRNEDTSSYQKCNAFNDAYTEVCTKIERDFLRKLMGGCSTPISALAEVKSSKVLFRANICSTDGSQKIEIQKESNFDKCEDLGIEAGEEILMNNSVKLILRDIKNEKISN